MKTLMSLSAMALLVSSLYASPASCPSEKCHPKMGVKSCNTDSCDSKKMKHNKHHKSKIVDMIMHLDLMDGQKEQIHNILEKQRENRENLRVAFTQEKFDKELFIKMKKQHKDKRIENKAQLIADIYAILTSEQKKELQSKLENKSTRKHTKMHCHK